MDGKEEQEELFSDCNACDTSSIHLNICLYILNTTLTFFWQSVKSLVSNQRIRTRMRRKKGYQFICKHFIYNEMRAIRCNAVRCVFGLWYKIMVKSFRHSQNQHTKMLQKNIMLFSQAVLLSTIYVIAVLRVNIFVDFTGMNAAI